MNSPPSDAFTLAMNHDSSVRRRQSRSLTRSPSPKISFASSHHHHHHPAAPRHRKPKPPPSEHSLAQVDEAADDVFLSPQRKSVVVDWEIPRKTLHSSIGFLSLWLYASHGSPQRVVTVLAISLCVIVPADILRLHYPPFARLYNSLLGFLMRESEKTKSNGVIWYMVGVIWVLTLYPLDIAMLSILILSWADTAASTFGRLWGSRTPPLPRRLFGLIPLAPRKSLAGFLAALITGASLAAGFWLCLAPIVDPENASWSFDQGPRAGGFDGVSVIGDWVRERVGGGVVGVGSGWTGIALVSAVSGIVTAVAEALDLGSLDDNLTLPIIAGGGIWACLKALSWFTSAA